MAVEIHSPYIDFVTDATTITVRRGQPFAPCVFKGLVKGIEALPPDGRIEVRAAFYFAGQRCGAARRWFTVVIGEHGEPLDDHAASLVATATEGGMAYRGDAPKAPLLTVVIEQVGTGRRELDWTLLYSADGALRSRRRGRSELGDAYRSVVDRFYRELEQCIASDHSKRAEPGHRVP